MSRTGSGGTWWGRAWLDAVEAIAGNRADRLGQGRRLARTGSAADLRISPSGADAVIRDQHGRTFDAHVSLRTFRDDEWDAVIDAISARASHAAALLDGELSPDVVEDAASVEVELLPRARDLRTVCTCADEAEPCAHAAAICHLLATALDADPFVLLLLRGLRRDEVLARLRARRTRPDAPGGDATVLGDDAALMDDGHVDRTDPAVAWSRTPGELPHVPSAANGPGRPAPWPSEPPPHAPFTSTGLRILVRDAARRAWEVAVGADATGVALSERDDLARRAAAGTGPAIDVLADRAGMAASDLEALATAWRIGGSAGVSANDEDRWDPPTELMAAARDAVISTGMASRRVHISGNRVSAEGQLQLRLSRDGRWYLFSRDSGAWQLVAPGADDVDELLDAAFLD